MEFEQSALFGDTRPCRMVVLGVGGAGCKMLNMLLRDGLDFDSIAMHSSAQALDKSSATRHFQLGAGLTQGLSTGGDIKMGQLCAENDEESLKALLESYDLVFMLVGLGGGTGSGAAPILARIAHGMDATTICLATTPFHFEGEARRKQGDLGLRALRQHADSVICYPNQWLVPKNSEGMSLTQAFEFSDRRLRSTLRSFSSLLLKPSVLHLDFADVKMLTSHSQGIAALASVAVEGPQAVDRCIQELLASPLLEQGEAIAKAQGLMIGVVGNPETPIADIDRIFRELGSFAQSDVHLFSGVAIEPLQSGLTVTVMATEQWSLEATPSLIEDAVADDGKTQNDKAAFVQTDLELIAQDKGKFKGSDPTVINGEDLDTPTYIRKNIRISG